MHLSIILDPRADVLHAGKRGGNGRVVPPPAHGCRAGGGEGAQAQRCGSGRHTSGAGRARHTARHRRDAAHAAAARRHARCPDEKTLCAHTVDWNMFYQEEKPE